MLYDGISLKWVCFLAFEEGLHCFVTKNTNPCIFLYHELFMMDFFYAVRCNFADRKLTIYYCLLLVLYAMDVFGESVECTFECANDPQIN